MAVEHPLPPEEALQALAAVARLDERSLRHIRGCARCRVAWYRTGAFRAGCTEPRLGARVVLGLGERVREPAVHAHLLQCLACRVLLVEAERRLAQEMIPGKP